MKTSELSVRTQPGTKIFQVLDSENRRYLEGESICELRNKIKKKSCYFVQGYNESEVGQLCSTLCDPMDCSLPGSSIHGIFQARMLEWVAMYSGIAELSNNVQVNSGVTEPHIYIHIHVHIHVFILPQSPCPFRLPHNIEQNFM